MFIRMDSPIIGLDTPLFKRFQLKNLPDFKRECILNLLVSNAYTD